MRHAIFAIILAFTGLSATVHAQVGITPSIQEIRLDQPAGVQTFRLHNFETRAKQVEVSLANWELDADGNIRILPSTEHSLDRWVIVSPLKFTMEPKSVQTVRIAVRPAVPLASGEHRAMVYFNEILPPRGPEETGMRGRFRIGAAIYAYQGEPNRIGTISDLAVSAQGLRAQLASTGNAHARLEGIYAIWKASAFPGLATGSMAGLNKAPDKEDWPVGVVAVAPLPNLPVLPGTQRPLIVDFEKLEPGQYVLEFRGAMSGKPAPQSLPFSVQKPAKGR